MRPTVCSYFARGQADGGLYRLDPSLGGVVGGLFLLFLVAFLVNFFAKRQRRRERDSFQRRLFRQGGEERHAWSLDGDDVEDDAASLGGVAYSDLTSPTAVAAGVIREFCACTSWYTGCTNAANALGQPCAPRTAVV